MDWTWIPNLDGEYERYCTSYFRAVGTIWAVSLASLFATFGVPKTSQTATPDDKVNDERD